MTMMTLQAACAVLARRHTVTDELTGFIIDRTFKPGDLRYSELEEYMNAWAVVRQFVDGCYEQIIVRPKPPVFETANATKMDSMVESGGSNDDNGKDGGK